ncbi:MAG: DUF1684 domain-containing protein [Flavobacteriales bacterium]|nr:DUF1684 domain-containing protein [Flavobacteriales bacterium]
MKDSRFTKWRFFLICSALTAFFVTDFTTVEAQLTWMEDVKKHRIEKDAEFSSTESSILTEDDLASFRGLDYFDIKPEFRVKARFKRIKNAKEFEMKTSTTRLPLYRPYGKIRFRFNGKKFELTIYQNMDLMKKPGYEDYLFLPFTDLTNSESTYGGGRYLDMRIGDLKNPIIDFNLCYNPYCAYNSKFSCPIPPYENNLDVSIEAGVKKFHD